MVRFAGAFIGFIAVGLCLLLAILLICGYDSTMDFMIQSIHQEHNSLEIKSKVSPQLFQILLGLLAFCLVVVLALKWYQSLWLPKLLGFMQELKNCLNKAFAQSTRFPDLLIYVLPFATAVYYLLYLPVSYDEAYTFLNFTSKTPIASLCFYPAPNNHVLHSLLTNFTYWLPFGNLTNMRLAAIVVSLITWMVLFHVIKSEFGSKTSVLVTSVTSVLFLSVFYSFESRGYGLLTFFTLISAYSAYKIYQQPQKSFFYQIWAIANVLGFFTMPSFLYPFMTITGILLIFKFQAYKKIVLNTLITIIGSAVMYLPIVIVSGANSLISNKFVLPIPREIVWSRLPNFLLDSISTITGFHAIFTIIPILIGLVILTIIGSKKLLFLSLTLLVAPIFLLLLQGVIPFSRTFLYYGFVLTAMAIFPWNRWIEKLPSIFVLTIAWIFQAIFIYNFSINISAFERYNTTFHAINQVIAKPNTSYYINSRLFDTNLNFELLAKGINRSKYVHKFGTEPMSADTISGYNYLILDKNLDATLSKKAFMEDPYVRVYQCN